MHVTRRFIKEARLFIQKRNTHIELISEIMKTPFLSQSYAAGSSWGEWKLINHKQSRKCPVGYFLIASSSLQSLHRNPADSPQIHQSRRGGASLVQESFSPKDDSLPMMTHTGNSRVKSRDLNLIQNKRFHSDSWYFQSLKEMRFGRKDAQPKRRKSDLG